MRSRSLTIEQVVTLLAETPPRLAALTAGLAPAQADSLVLLQSGQFVAPVKTAQDAQTTLTIFALFCGIALLLFVEPPTPFWVGGNELRGDKRIVYLALAMCIVSVLLISLSPLRSLFDLALLDWPDFLVIAVYVVIWVFLVRWAWRGHILERFLALE